MSIEYIMSSNIISVDINDSIEDISKIMKENDIGMVLVTEDKKYVGILTDRDIVTKILANKDNKIKEYYTKKIVTIDVDNSIEQAINKMRENKIKRLVVSKKNEFVGVLSLSDVVFYCDDKLFNSAFKEIYEISKNMDSVNVKINEFEL